VPSELTEDEVKAFVVAAPDRSLDFEQLRVWTAARLSAFKVPRFWQALDALPRTPDVSSGQAPPPDGHPADEYDAQPDVRAPGTPDAR
jgi:crotonobetaine/carnitine-CoA ligase